jgi:hypothetical protein
MNPFEPTDSHLSATIGRPARAWRPPGAGLAGAPGGESSRCAPAPLLRTAFSEQFRSVSEFPRYLTQGVGQGRV